MDKISRLKQDREADQEELSRLHQTKERLAKLARAEIRLTEFCARVRENLARYSIQEKRLALDALDIKVYARGTDDVEIQGVIPLELPTIERTSA